MLRQGPTKLRDPPSPRSLLDPHYVVLISELVYYFTSYRKVKYIRHYDRYTFNTFISSGLEIKAFNAIKKTRLYNVDPLKPHFYVIKLGFIGVYIIFLISAQKHRSLMVVKFSIYLNKLVFVMAKLCHRC